MISWIAASSASTLVDICITDNAVRSPGAAEVRAIRLTTVENLRRHVIKFGIKLFQKRFHLDEAAECDCMSDEIAAILTNAVSSCGLDMSPEFAVFAVVDVAVEVDGAGDLDGAPAALTLRGRAGDEGGGMVVVSHGRLCRGDRVPTQRSAWGTWHFHYWSDAAHLSCFLTAMISCMGQLLSYQPSSSGKSDSTATHVCYTLNRSSPEYVSAGREAACLAFYRENATLRLRQNHTTAGLRDLAICGSSSPQVGL